MGAQDDVLVHKGVAQVQKTVFQAHIFARLRRFINVKGKLVLRKAQNVQRVRHQFHLAGGELWVKGVSVAPAQNAAYGDNALAANAL